MEVRRDRVVAVHHFNITAEATPFFLEAKQLKPYLLTEGKWVLRVQHLSCSGQLGNDSSLFDKVYRIVSPNICPESGTPLTLASFAQEELEVKGKTKFFPASRSHLISMKSDRVYFSLEALGGEPAKIKSGSLLLGVELVQIQ